MKKNLTKIGIGTIALAIFVAVGFTANNNTYSDNSTQKIKNKNMIQRSQTGHFTRGGGVKKNSYNQAQSRYGVIYIGESTEGLLD